MPGRPWIALVALLVGCSAPAASPVGESLAPSSAPTRSERPPPEGTLDFTWPDGDQPVVTRKMTGIAERYINPGAMIDHDGTLHMFANVFSRWPGRVQVPHLTSTDGGAWELAAEGPVMTSDDVPSAAPGHDVSTGFVTDDGTWVLVFQTVNGTGPWEIGIATAPGPDGPWTIAPEPVLTAGDNGGADALGLAWPSVVPTDDGYAMYYTIMASRGGGGEIGMATSTDGMTWTGLDEPVLVAEADWEGQWLDRPRVARTPSGEVMVYSGARLTDRGVAWSDDGVSWTRDANAPAISAEDFPVTGLAWDAALIERDGVLTYFLEIGLAGASGSTEVYRATAGLP